MLRKIIHLRKIQCKFIHLSKILCKITPLFKRLFDNANSRGVKNNFFQN